MKKMTGKGMRIAAALGICASLMLGTPGMSISAMAATSTVDGAMIRNEPSTDAGIIGSLYEGDEVTVLGAKQSGDGYTWYYIQLDNGNTGYVRGDLLSVDDSEIEALGLEEDESAEGEEVQETEETAEEEAAPEEETEAGEGQAEETPEEAPAEAEQAQPKEQAQEEPAAESGEYDAAKDPNANLRLVFENEENGKGSWYVYNDDNGTKIRVGDMTSQAQTEQAAKPAAGPWKTAAIIFGLIAVALAAFVLFMLKSIRDDRNTIARRRVARGTDGGSAAGNDYDDDLLFDKDEALDDDEDPDADEASESGESSENYEASENDEAFKKGEAFFGDRGEELPGDASDVEEVTEKFEDSTVEYDEPVGYEEEEIPEIKAQESGEAALKDAGETAGPGQAAAAEAAEEEAFEDGEYVSDEEEAGEEGASDEVREETRDEASGEPDEEYEEDFEEEDGEYDEESNEYFEELSDDEEEISPGSPKKQAPGAGGGIAGFFRKLFGSDSKEDDDDDEYDDDEYDDDDEFVFDEYKEYPEDVDLLPREEGADDFEDYDEEDYDEEEYDEEEESRARLSVQKVMKRAGRGEREEDFSDEEGAAGFGESRADGDLSEPLFDDDDDMEYSFLGSRTRR